MISLATILVNEKVRKNIKACLDENRLGGGRFIEEFENKVAEYMGVKHAIAVCNGSMADIIALASLKTLRPKKTEVIVPALTFVAQTNAILVNGLTPVFIDINEDFQINVESIEKRITNNTLAISTVHLLGKGCEIELIKEIADKNNVYLLEDCCEAYGGELAGGVKFGTLGVFGTFSFFPSHTITTGEGGMIITDDRGMAELARKVSNHGRRSNNILEKFHFDVMGFNGKMSNILASIGCAVIKEADRVIKKRKDNVEYLNGKLEKDWYASSPHCYPMIYNTKEERDDKLIELDESNIEARKLFSSLPTQEKVYKEYAGNNISKADRIGERGLFVPIHQDLTKKDLDKIAKIL